MLLCLNTNLQVEASPGLLGKLIVKEGAAIGLGGLLAKGPPNINIEDQRAYNSGDVDIDNSNKGVIGKGNIGNNMVGDNNHGAEVNFGRKTVQQDKLDISNKPVFHNNAQRNKNGNGGG